MAIALTVGCDAQESVRPGEMPGGGRIVHLEEPTISGAPTAHATVQPQPDASGTYVIPLPIGPSGSLTGRFWYVPADLGFSLPDRTLYKVRVEGALTATLHPEYAWYCPRRPWAPCGELAGSYGPAGGPGGELRVNVFVRSTPVVEPVEGGSALEGKVSFGGPVEAHRKFIGTHIACYDDRPPEKRNPPLCYQARSVHKAPEYVVTGTQLLIFEPAADQLQVTADTALVHPGQTVTFTASTEEAPFQITRWIWEPAEGAEEAHTQACTHTEAVCAVPVYEDGTMYARAVVNGITEQAGASVKVVERELIVDLHVANPILRPEVPEINFHGYCAKPYPRVPGGESLITVVARYTDGTVAKRADVEITTTFVPTSGGHDHQDEPRSGFGTFRQSNSSSGGSVAEFKGTTDEAGVLSVTYQAGAIGGQEKLRVVVRH
ncbi:MAG TPA: hypothetical protein VF158_13785, partial [Longimicrobiales bacterium]